ncbi:unnamed protein product [Rotaria sp. Silwood1]|nr:unnamed protein product [Rotaria sp. Silwood1]
MNYFRELIIKKQGEVVKILRNQNKPSISVVSSITTNSSVMNSISSTQQQQSHLSTATTVVQPSPSMPIDEKYHRNFIINSINNWCERYSSKLFLIEGVDYKLILTSSHDTIISAKVKCGCGSKTTLVKTRKNFQISNFYKHLVSIMCTTISNNMRAGKVAKNKHQTNSGSADDPTSQKGLSDPGISRLPSRDNIKRRIRMLRQNKNVVAAPNDPNFASIPTLLTRTVRQDQFLCCDTGPGMSFNVPIIVLATNVFLSFIEGDDRILIFSSPEQLDILQSVNDFLVDGTFKVVPEIFYQLYIIHAIYRGHVVPVLYALLRRKNAATYQNLIDQILQFAPHWNPNTIMLDFEQACIGVYETNFPNVLLSGCYFHLRQSIHRKLQALGCQNKYESDPAFSHNIHKIAASAFLKPDEVIKGYEALSLDLDDDY